MELVSGAAVGFLVSFSVTAQDKFGFLGMSVYLSIAARFQSSLLPVQHLFGFRICFSLGKEG